MPWLNYHHLLYFWTVARTGSVTKACQELNLTQPAVSAQIRMLEKAFGEKLFVKRGRNLVLTDVGRLVYRYADEIFLLGREMQETLAGRPSGRPQRLVVGVCDQVPKLIAFRLLEPVLRRVEGVQLVLRDDKPERLFADLAIHSLDLVISDAPVGASAKVRAFNHLLGETDVSIYGAPTVAAHYRRKFPESLDGAPFLLPAEGSMLRRSLTAWFDSVGVRPNAVAEIDDSALLKTFGQGGIGLFAAPTAIEADVMHQYGVKLVGRVESVRERFYAVSVERKITHPVVKEISSEARETLFG
ncbi:MAG TPA: transcriptional activator NhaR [Gemmatimonadaceae bacterium]|nr:transcriptional activator NhaR [Gemmatimonadaceae bacterium]